jgi:hypothetical protein
MAFDIAGYLSQFTGGGAGGGFDPSNLGQYGIDLGQLFGNQQGFIGGLGSPSTANMGNIMQQLQGFGGGQQTNPFLQSLQGFNPQVGGGVQNTLTSLMQNPFSQAGQGTLEQMLTTGAPVDVSGIGNAAAMRANQAFESLTGGAREQAALQGGLAGSGFANKQAQIGGNLAELMQAMILEGGVGAAENAANRRMGALGLDLQGAGARAGAAGTLGGLQNQLSGQQLQAMLGGGQLAGQQSGQQLQALLGAGGLASGMDKLGFAGQQAQAGAGQSFLNSLPGFAGAGFFDSPNQPMTAEAIAHYVRTIGNAENQGQRDLMQMLGPYLQNPTNAPAPAAPAGGGGGVPGGNAQRGAAFWKKPIAQPLGIGIGSTHPGSIGSAGTGIGSNATPGVAAAPGTGIGGPSFSAPSFTAPSFTPPGQPMPAHPAAQPPANYDQWANYWNQYSQQFANPALFTAGGVAA